jgi:hypothetical protein
MKTRPNVLAALKNELEFLASGGYAIKQEGRPPTLIFEGSPICLNHGSPTKLHPCSDCALFDLVPPGKRRVQAPCRHIPLNEEGETVHSLYRTATQCELERKLERWLRATIQRIEQVRAEVRGRQENRFERDILKPIRF